MDRTADVLTRPFDSIFAQFHVVPYGERELQVLADQMAALRAKGYDLSPGHPVLAATPDSIAELAGRGAVLLHVPDNPAAAALFAKVQTGTGFFGGQKLSFISFHSLDMAGKDWLQGAAFKRWDVALTALRTICRPPFGLRHG